MKSLLLTLTACVLLSACNNSATNSKTLNDTVNVSSKISEAETKSERQLLIEELKSLRDAFASKDKEKIAVFFQFPLPDTVGINGGFTGDPFYDEIQKNGGKINKNMFLRFFSNVAEEYYINDLNETFNVFNLDSLSQKDDLKHNVNIENSTCQYSYNINIEKDIIWISKGKIDNESLAKDSSPSDEAPENFEYCRGGISWALKFDGKNLYFIKKMEQGI